MRRVLVLLSATLASVVLVGAQQQEPAFRGGTHTVAVYATVLDANGRLVPDLTRDDFDVFDNGVRQDLSLFANETQPITIVVMLDRSGSMWPNFDLERDAAEQFIQNLRPADQARIGSFSTRIQIDPVGFTSDRAVLSRILRDNLQQGGPTPLWNATSAAMTALKPQAGRRVVLMFTDGEDSPDRTDQVNVSFGEVRDRAQLEEVMVYAIGLADFCAPSAIAEAVPSARFQRGGTGGRGGPGRGAPGQGIPRGPGVLWPPVIRLPPAGPARPLPPPGGFGEPRDEGRDKPCLNPKPDPNLRQLADDSGGGYFELRNADNLAATFLRVADELHHQYMMAFTANARDGRTHVIEVRAKRPGLTARARRSYVAPKGST